MALQTSGPISFSDIRDEFDPFNTSAIELSRYYRGGLLVPNTPANANIPLSGPIALSNFYGASAGGGGNGLEPDPGFGGGGLQPDPGFNP